MGIIVVSLALTYETKEGVNMDEAVAAVATNMDEMLILAGIRNGKPMPDSAATMHLMAPPFVARMVDLIDVKHMIVLGPK